MIWLGIVLLLIGILVAYLGPGEFQAIGKVLGVIGLVLILLGVILVLADSADVHTALLQLRS